MGTPAVSADITGPTGTTVTVSARPDKSFIYSDTDSAGIYAITADGDEESQQMIPANLLDRRESNLTVREKLELGYEELTGVRTQQETRREFWPWILLGALVVLMIEWVVFNKRVFI